MPVQINNKRLIDTFCDFVKIPSESPDDKAFISYLEQLFIKEGAKTFIDSYGNLLAKFDSKNSENKESVLFCCHADTVQPGKGIEPIVENGFIKSAGKTILGADDKAGIAEIVEMLRSVKKNPPIEILITRCEEIGTLGIRSVNYENIKSKRAYVLDGDAIDGVIVGGPTYISFDVSYKGKSAHAGMEPENGISAIQAASYAISKMQLGRLDNESTANVGKFEGGVIRNGIPENAKILAECRSLNHEKCLKNAEKMRKLFEEGAKKYGAEVTIDQQQSIKAYKISTEEFVVKELISTLEKFNVKPKIYSITGGSDSSILNEKGITTVLMGAGYKKEHTIDEYVTISDMETITKVIIDIVENIA